MSIDDRDPRLSGASRLPTSLAIVLIAVAAGFAWWQNGQTPKSIEPAPTTDRQTTRPVDSTASQESLPDENEPSHSEVTPEPERGRHSGAHSHVEHSVSSSEKNDDGSYKIDNQTIRDLNGRVVYKGTIDLNPTLDRIRRGESNRHRNDGTPFQNREGRLPRKPSGYYKEYVHPTPGKSGPGPQRIIIGRNGDIWYTPDHYKTFTQVKSQKKPTD